MSIRYEVTLPQPAPVKATLSVLTDGEGYSRGADHPCGHTVELGIWTSERTFCLPSQIGLDAKYDRLFDGDQEYGGVAAYVPWITYQMLRADFHKLGEQAGAQREERAKARACKFDLGDRVVYKGNSAIRGTVIDFEISDHPGIGDEVTVQLDPGMTMLVMSKETSVVGFYTAALDLEEKEIVEWHGK